MTNMIKKLNEYDLIQFLKTYGVENYTVKNGVVDVDGNVNISNDIFEKIPVKFGKITGWFSCSDNIISTLKNSPYHVDKAFDITNNLVSSLKYGPNYVGGYFSCYKNKLTNLIGSPQHVGGDFRCVTNQITSLEGCPVYIGGDFVCYDNKLTTLALPMNFHIELGFYCNDNDITDPTHFGRLFFGTVNGLIFTGYKKLDEFLNKNKNPPKKDLPKLLSELRKIPL